MKVLLADEIEPGAAVVLRAHHDVIDVAGAPDQAVAAVIADREALVVHPNGRPVTADLLDRARQLRVIVRTGPGLDGLDLGDLRERGIKVVRIISTAPQAVAELTLGLLLALSRRIVEADRLRWRDGRPEPLLGSGLAGKTIGIVGAGTIGARVGELAVALGMRAMGCVEHRSKSSERALCDRQISLTSFDRVLAGADVVSVHVPLTAHTRGLMDRAAIAAMRPGSLLLHLAHRDVVDEWALAEALRSGHLAGAALDIADGRPSPLARLENALLTPHLGAMTVETQRDIGSQLVQTLAIWSSSIAGSDTRLTQLVPTGAA